MIPYDEYWLTWKWSDTSWMIPFAIYWMNIWMNRHHSCECVGHHQGTTEQPTCCIRCSPIKWGKLSWLGFTKKIQEGSHLTSTTSGHEIILDGVTCCKNQLILNNWYNVECYALFEGIFFFVVCLRTLSVKRKFKCMTGNIHEKSSCFFII